MGNRVGKSGGCLLRIGILPYFEIEENLKKVLTENETVSPLRNLILDTIKDVTFKNVTPGTVSKKLRLIAKEAVSQGFNDPSDGEFLRMFDHLILWQILENPERDRRKVRLPVH